jgi:putative FmdB family regulatory protein
MPTYEYKCNNCGDRFEKFQSIKADPIRKCPKCGKNAVERLISAGGGLIFKGSGFYITDYRDASYNDKAKADAGGDKSEKSDAAAPAAGADAKPAASDAKASAASKSDAAPAPAPAAATDAKPQSKPAKSQSAPVKSSSRKR